MDEDDFIRNLAPYFGQGDLSDPVIEFHEGFAHAYGDYYLTLVKKVKPALEEIPVHNRFFNDHGPRHSYRIIFNLGILANDYDPGLTPVERYVLASCAWLHDIGMSINKKINSDHVLSEALEEIPEWFLEIGTTGDEVETINDNDIIRKWHHILSWDFVRSRRELLGFPNYHVANTVAEVCRVHREGIEIDHLDNGETIRINSSRGEINLRAISALFQFADALDVTSERAPEISTEIQDLPSASEPHWRRNQLINDFYYDDENRLIVLKASHTNEEDKDLLKNIVAELYSEYRDVEDTLVSEPYPFSLADVKCETTHRESFGSGGTTTLSGKDEHINQIKKEGEQKEREQSSGFEELQNDWTFRILDASGDARISRRMKIRLLDGDFTERTHFVRSFDSTHESEWASEVQAYDVTDRELPITVEIDRPNHKRFNIIFPDGVRAGDTFEYAYEYEWADFFPKRRRNSSSPATILSPPSNSYFRTRYRSRRSGGTNSTLRTTTS